jgi:hypothetical protein
MYIKATYKIQPITVYKGKVPRVKPARPEEIPEAYRKVKYAKLKYYLSELFIYAIGLKSLFETIIRKGNEK